MMIEPVLAFGMPGPMEMLIIFGVLALLFGTKKIPQIANSFGRSLSEFKRGKKQGEKALKEVEKEVEKELKDITSD